MQKKYFYYLLIIFCFGFFTSLEAKPKKESTPNVLKQSWQASLKTGSPSKSYRPEVASPIIYQSKVLVGTHSGVFYCLNASNGEILWQAETSGPIASKPVAENGVVFIGNNKGSLYAFNINDGEKIWETHLSSEILSAPVIYKDKLYVKTTRKRVYAILKDRGIIKWEKRLRIFNAKFSIRGLSKLLVDQGGLYTGFSDGSVLKLSLIDGDVIWKQNLAPYEATFKDIDQAIYKDENHLYISGHYGKLAKLNLSNGNIVWTKDIKSSLSIYGDQHNIYVGLDKGDVLGIDQKTGLSVWGISAGNFLSDLAYSQNKLVTISGQGELFIMRANTGEILAKTSVDAKVYGAPAIESNFLVFLNENGTLVSYRF